MTVLLHSAIFGAGNRHESGQGSGQYCYTVLTTLHVNEESAGKKYDAGCLLLRKYVLLFQS